MPSRGNMMAAHVPQRATHHQPGLSPGHREDTVRGTCGWHMGTSPFSPSPSPSKPPSFTAGVTIVSTCIELTVCQTHCLVLTAMP